MYWPRGPDDAWEMSAIGIAGPLKPPDILLLRDELGGIVDAQQLYGLSRIHRRTPMDGVRAAEGGG